MSRKKREWYPGAMYHVITTATLIAEPSGRPLRLQDTDMGLEVKN
jgi:hypothetical protein